MKILTIIVPCYNSEAYMNKCIDSLIIGGDTIEILIINDGSADQTRKIADKYMQRYPKMIRAIHQKNGGHGAAVNTGIDNATGLYIKVVDSDDWVNSTVLEKIVKVLESLVFENNPVDMLLSNFIYDKEGVTQKTVMHYEGIIPQDRVILWKDIGKFSKGKYILMHSVIYSLDVLKRSGLKLPRHTFYVDNLFVYLPLPYVKSLYYIKVNFYHYYIGRADQSVNEKVMIDRIDQQLIVNKTMIKAINLREIDERKKRKYMRHYLEIVTIVSTIILLRSGTKENLKKKQELWKDIRRLDWRLFYRLRNGILGSIVNLPGKTGRKLSLVVYKLTQQIIGFN